MPMVLMPDLDEKFLKTLIGMWEDPEKRQILEAEGTEESHILQARQALARLLEEKKDASRGR